MGDVAKDLTAGTIGGAAQLIVGHPFDTIKVKLQSQPVPLPGQLPKFSGALDAVKQTIAAEGLGGLYKGMGAPLATVAAFNAVLFTVRGQLESLLKSDPGARLTISQQIACGAGAGVAVSFLACPTELIKCRLQAQSALADVSSSGGGVKYGGPMDVAKQVLRSEGGMRGLFKGLAPTFAREVPGNAAMFGVYEGVKQLIAGGQDTSGLGRGGRSQDSDDDDMNLLYTENLAQNRKEATRRQRIEAEQRRRDELRDGYAKLKDVLPVSNQKSSKVSLLDRATSHIVVLESENKALLDRITGLEDEIRRLQQINEKLSGGSLETPSPGMYERPLSPPPEVTTLQSHMHGHGGGLAPLSLSQSHSHSSLAGATGPPLQPDPDDSVSTPSDGGF